MIESATSTPEEIAVEPNTNPTPAPDAAALATPASDPLDPFSPEKLLLSTAFNEGIPTKKLRTNVACRKPKGQEWIQCQAGACHNLAFIEWKVDREWYLVSTHLVPDLATECIYATLHVAVNDQGTVFLWPIRLPDRSGRDMAWWVTQRDAAKRASNGVWIRLVSNTDAGCYDIWQAQIKTVPAWPEEDFWQLVRIAFKDRLIDTLEYAIVRKLRGLAP
jgi:hypothetical protein